VNPSRFDELARRKQTLVIKAAQERAEMAGLCRKIQSSLDLKQSFLGIGRTLKAHPVITAGASSILVSGLAGKLIKGAGQVFALSRLAMPLWAWWKSRRGSS
jgi:hypothetical protein